MTANRGLFVRNLGTTGTTPIEGRLVLASMVAENSPGVPRQGLLDQRAATLVTGSASNMSYNVGPCNPVLNRAAGEGVYMFSLTGTTNVVTDAAPGTGSRWDLVYVKQNDPDKGDATNTAVLGVHKGTAAASPTKPYGTLPAGAYVLAEVLVNAGAANAAAAGVTITQTWRYTALRGAPIPVRNTTERAEITPGSLAVGVTVRRLDVSLPTMDAVERWNGTAWTVPWAYAEFNNNAFAVAGGLVNWDVGALTQDNSKTWNNTFASTAGALSGAINILENGLYTVTFLTSPSGSPGRAGLILKNGSSQTYASSFTDGAVWEMTGTFTRYLTAGSYVRGVLIQNNSTTNATTAAIMKHTGTWT